MKDGFIKKNPLTGRADDGLDLDLVSQGVNRQFFAAVQAQMGGVEFKPLREPVFVWFYESKDYSVQLGGWREVNDLAGVFSFFERFSQMLLLLRLSIRPLGGIYRKDCLRILVPNGCRRWSVESLQEAW